jgi:hypothetical protein
MKKEKMEELQTILDKKFAEYCKQAQDTFHKKNLRYGNAIRTGGVVGQTYQLIGAVLRLRQLVIEAEDYGASEIETIKDILQDIHVYSEIVQLMIDSNNWTGDI